MINELSLEFEELNQNNKQVMSENAKDKKTIEQLNQTILNLKKEVFEGSRRMSELKEDIESEFELEKKKLESNIRKLKAENSNARKDLEDEIDELKDKLEKKKAS